MSGTCADACVRMLVSMHLPHASNRLQICGGEYANNLYALNGKRGC